MFSAAEPRAVYPELLSATNKDVQPVLQKSNKCRPYFTKAAGQN